MKKSRPKPGHYYCENCGEEILKMETHYSPPFGRYKAGWLCTKEPKK